MAISFQSCADPWHKISLAFSILRVGKSIDNASPFRPLFRVLLQACGGRKAPIGATMVAFLVLACVTARAQLVPLSGNHPAAASRLGGTGLSGERRLDLELIVALRNRSELDSLLRDVQDRKSPRYHRWLSSEEFNHRFGPADQEFIALEEWLTVQGFVVKTIDRLERSIRFNANVAQAEESFRVSISATPDGRHFGNNEDPMVPERLAPFIESIRGLSNLVGHYHVGDGYEPPRVIPGFKIEGGPLAFGPDDVYSFYEETSQFDGSGGDCLALIEDTNFLGAAIDAFDSTFDLPAVQLSRVFPEADPGIINDELEALLDIEWAHAVAPGAAIRVYIGNGDIFAPIQRAIAENACGAISISFQYCGAEPAFFANELDPLFAQAAAQGQSITVASGDYGAAALFYYAPYGCAVAEGVRGVNEMAADPNVTGVGGTQFVPNYDGNGNNVGHVDESAWNQQNAATGGGASAIFSKPSWQEGPGVPDDGQRDVPDVAFGASPAAPGFYLAVDDSGTPALACCIGGTSIGAPIWAGIAKLFAQSEHGRVGNLSPALSGMGAIGNSTFSGLRDVVTGNNTLWYPAYVTGFEAGPGYDQTTGWGTPDIATLVARLSSSAPGGSVIVTARANRPASSGGTIAAGTFRVTNTSSVPEILNGISIAFSDPGIFRSSALGAIAGATVTAAKIVSPGTATAFSFAKPLRLSPGKSATIRLVVTMARAPHVPSEQIVTAIKTATGTSFSGVPASLGIITHR